MDAHERSLLKSYTRAVAALKRIPPGDPRHDRAVKKMLYFQQALAAYRRSLNN